MSDRNFDILKPALSGALVATVLLALGLTFFGDPRTQTFEVLVAPFLTVPLGGAVGGIFYSFLNQLNFKTTRISILINFFSVLLYLFLLLMAFAVGTDVPL